MESGSRIQILKLALALAVLMTGCVAGSENTMDPELAQRAIAGFLEHIEQRDLTALRDAVDVEFVGDRASILDQLTDVLDTYQDIRFEIHVKRYVMDEEILETTFRWSRRWRSKSNGAETLTSGTSTLRFRQTESSFMLTSALSRPPWQ